MKLITAAIRKKLEANFKKTSATGETVPVVLKLFGGSCFTWLITDIDTDGDTMMGLCDIGQGHCDFGSVSLSKLSSTRFPPFGLGVERDLYFSGGTVESFRAYYEKSKEDEEGNPTRQGSLNGC